MPKPISRRDAISYAGASALGLSVLPHATSASPTTADPLKIMVAGGHPDDPETGAGGAMALYAEAGHEVIAAYLTTGEAGIHGTSHEEAARIRKQEAIEACKILNATPHFLGQIDGSSEVTSQRYQEVYDFLEKEAPDVVFTHWPIDTHRDHRICSLLMIDAWQNLGRPFDLFYYEVVSGGQTQTFAPRQYLNITPVIDKKHRACFIHKSQKIEEVYDKDHGMMERFRGMEYQCDYAEAFIAHSLNKRGLL